jgi:hypothetical protein
LQSGANVRAITETTQWRASCSRHGVDWRAVLPLLSLACDPSITVTSGSARQVSWDAFIETNLPALLVVAIDDGDDPNAAAARSKLTREGLLSSIDMLLLRAAPWPYDPASGFTADARIVLVHPTTGMLVTPLDDPRLEFGAGASVSDSNAVADAVLEHAGEALVAETTAYPLVAHTRDAVSLLLRERPPRDSREESIVASMPSAFRVVTVTMLTSRDDSSRVEEIPPASEADRVEYDVKAPCTTTLPDVPNLQAWRKALSLAHVFSWISQAPCGDASPMYIYAQTEDFGCQHISAADIARDETGAAECSIVFHSTNGTSREIPQLTGNARTSCEQSIACDDCTPGFCVTSLLDIPACPHVARFVHSAIDYPARLHFTCNLK